MTSLVTFAIAILAALAFASQVKILRTSGAMARDPQTLVGLVLILLSLLFYQAGVIPTGQTAQVGIVILMFTLALLLVVRSIRQRTAHKIRLSTFLPCLIAALVFAVNTAMNPELESSQALGRSLGIFSLAIICLIVSLNALTLRELTNTIVMSLSLVFVVSPFIGENWRPCDVFKCGPFDALYTGPFISENTVAMLCGVGWLCAFIGSSPKKNIAAFAFFALALYATESRTAQLAVAVAVGIWPLAILAARLMHGRSNVAYPSPKHRRSIVALFSCGVGGLFLVGFHLLSEATPTDFSNRGKVWILGLAALGEDWVTGLGVDRWYILQSVGAVPAHFPHSEYLFLLFTGGVGAVIGLFCILVQSINRASWQQSIFPFAASYVVYLGVTGLTELYWNPIASDGNFVVILPLIFIMAKVSSNNCQHESERLPTPGRTRTIVGKQQPINNRATHPGRRSPQSAAPTSHISSYRHSFSSKALD